MTELIRSARKAQSISVNELAARLGVTPGAISQMERSEREGTIKLQTIRSALAALGQEILISSTKRTPLSDFAPARIGPALARAIDSGNPAFALRLLTQAVHSIREAPENITGEELETPPPALPDPRWGQLFRALYREAMRQGAKPAWTKTTKLDEPWFLSNYPFLRERARETTPEFLRKLNIFVDQRSLTPFRTTDALDPAPTSAARPSAPAG